MGRQVRAVLRDALQPLRLAGAVIALDGVEREVQAAGALEQAHVPGAQLVDLLPALQGGGGALALLQGHALRPAGGVRRDLLPDGLAQAVPQVPAVAGLDRRWQRLADGLAVSTRPITAHDLDPGMIPQPLLDGVGGAAGEDVNAPAGLGVDEHGRVDAAAAQREVIDSTRGTVTSGRGICRRTRSAVCRDTAMPSAGSSRAEARPANPCATALTWAVSREMRRW
jgi:hypothetical protein